MYFSTIIFLIVCLKSIIDRQLWLLINIYYLTRLDYQNLLSLLLPPSKLFAIVK